MRFILVLILSMIASACATKTMEPAEDGSITLFVKRIKKTDWDAAGGGGESLPEPQKIDGDKQEFFAQIASRILSDLAAPNPKKGSTRAQVLEALSASPMMVVSEDVDRVYARSSVKQNEHVLISYRFTDGSYDGLEIGSP